MKPLLLTEIAAALGVNYTGNEICTSISSDSRKMDKGSVFVAIVGEVFDGHKFVDAAFDKGAVAAVISNPDYAIDGKPCFVVDDTKDAYIKLGGLYRTKFDARCVAVTGSVGKTTTKDFIACVLSVFGKTQKTLGNQNNEIGFPNTLFDLTDDTKMLVAEMGMSGFNEIAPMTIAAAPEVAVVTNIGVSHLEAMGTRENILKEKLDIAKGLQGAKVLVLNDDNDLLSTVDHLEDVNIVRVGIASERADFTASDILTDGFETSFTLHHKEQSFACRIPALGDYNVLNALIAVAVAHSLGFDIESAATGLMNYVPSGMRQHVVNCGDITVIEDCYNASPDSMRASVGTLTTHFKNGRTIAVLADMLELGAASADMHKGIGEFAGTSGLDVLLCYGDMSVHMARGAVDKGVKKVLHFNDKDILLASLLGILQKGDTVLFKGSHGMKLEQVIEKLYHTYPPVK